MSTIVTRKVVDLPEPSKQNLEQLLGRGLAPDERVSVIVDVLIAPRTAKQSRTEWHSRA